MNFPKFIIKKSTDDQFYFNLWSKEEDIILKSEMYTTKQNCKNGIESIKTNSPLDKNYDRKSSNNSKYYFVLKSQNNGQVIGTSNLYSNILDRDKAIERTKIDAPSAETEDLS